jgi:hypothetical protein
MVLGGEDRAGRFVRLCLLLASLQCRHPEGSEAQIPPPPEPRLEERDRTACRRRPCRRPQADSSRLYLRQPSRRRTWQRTCLSRSPHAQWCPQQTPRAGQSRRCEQVCPSIYASVFPRHVQLPTVARNCIGGKAKTPLPRAALNVRGRFARGELLPIRVNGSGVAGAARSW